MYSTVMFLFFTGGPYSGCQTPQSREEGGRRRGEDGAGPEGGPEAPAEVRTSKMSGPHHP